MVNEDVYFPLYVVFRNSICTWAA